MPIMFDGSLNQDTQFDGDFVVRRGVVTAVAVAIERRLAVVARDCEPFDRTQERMLVTRQSLKGDAVRNGDHSVTDGTLSLCSGLEHLDANAATAGAVNLIYVAHANVIAGFVDKRIQG